MLSDFETWVYAESDRLMRTLGATNVQDAMVLLQRQKNIQVVIVHA